MPNVDPYVDQVMDALRESFVSALNDTFTKPLPPSAEQQADAAIKRTQLRTVVRQAIVDAADHGAAQREQLVEGLIASDCTIEIVGCAACPFSDGACCVHPIATTTQLKPFILRKRGERVPGFCPLRVRPTRVLLAEGV